MKLKMGIVRFLGTNCDRDVWEAVEAAGFTPEWLWYQDRFDASEYAGAVVAGGFSYGDYLRSGALAALAPVMKDVIAGAKKGLPILGICNGFQVLCEAGLLPGTLIKNQHLRFVDEWSLLKGVGSNRFWSGEPEKSIRLPIAHGDGRYYLDPDELKQVEDKQQVWWTYENNPNGSVGDIAGVMNEAGNVAGLMPHPERAIFDWMGGTTDGTAFFKGVV